MNLRKFKHDPADLLRQGEEIAAKRNIDPRYKSRVIAVNMVLSGRNTVAQAAELAGVSRMAVNGWVRTADQEGFEALKDKKRGGRKPRLSADQKQELRAVLQSDPPKKHNVWDGITLSAYIKERFGSCASAAASTCSTSSASREFARRRIPARGKRTRPRGKSLKKKS